MNKLKLHGSHCAFNFIIALLEFVRNYLEPLVVWVLLQAGEDLKPLFKQLCAVFYCTLHYRDCFCDSSHPLFLYLQWCRRLSPELELCNLHIQLQLHPCHHRPSVSDPYGQFTDADLDWLLLYNGLSFLLGSGLGWVLSRQCVHQDGRRLFLLIFHDLLGWGFLWSHHSRRFRHLHQYFGYFWASFFGLFLHPLCRLLYHFLRIDNFWG